MYEAVFKSIDDVLRKDAGCSSELDYIEQTSWILFLKYLDDYETEKEKEAQLKNEKYNRIITGQYRWEQWASPKKADGTLDRNIALSGEDLLNFVNNELFPYLAKFKQAADSPRSLYYKIGEIFGEIRNKLQTGYSLRDVIDKIDQLRFLSDKDKHELGDLYENKIKNMGNAGKNGGEYYTPRPLIKSIVQVIDPKIGNSVYDGAVGSAGFLCEAYNYMRSMPDDKTISTKDYRTLQDDTFIGKEKKSLAYVIGVMNMILHGIEAPNIIHKNTLSESIFDIQEKDRVNVILANPPFGGSEYTEVQHNFEANTGETAYLFLEHFINMLKADGRCGVVIKNTFLSNSDNASIGLRKQLLKDCNLFAVLDLPSGVFLRTGVKTVVLFFQKGKPTKKIWYYQLNLDRNLGKTDPLNESDLAEFLALQESKDKSENSWFVDVANIDKGTWDLTVKNPNRIEEVDNRTPQEILVEIEVLDAETSKTLQVIKELLELKKSPTNDKLKKKLDGVSLNFEECIEKIKTPSKLPKKAYLKNGAYPVIAQENALINGYSNDKNLVCFLDSPLILFGDHTRKLKYIDFNFVLGADGAKLIKPKANINVKFFYYYLSLLMPKSRGYQRHYKFLKELNFIIPPVAEQKSIVDKLDKEFAEIDKAIELAEVKKVEIKKLKHSLLANKLGAKNDNWQVVKLSKIVEVSMGKTPPRDSPKMWDKEKISNNVWLSIADLTASKDMHVNDSKEYVSDEWAKLSKEVPANTLIMSFKLSIGKLAITGRNLRTNEAIAAFEIKDKDSVTNEYLLYYLSSLNWDKIVGEDVKVKGKTLNKVKLKELPVLLPPLAEQNRIVDKLDKGFVEIDGMMEITKKQINQYKALKSAILVQELQGETI